MDSSFSGDDLSDYDVVSDPGRRSLDSSVADLMLEPPNEIKEPAPLQEALDKFLSTRLSPGDIQSSVRAYLGFGTLPVSNGNGTLRKQSHAGINDYRTRRIYVDGIFDMFNVGHAHQLRQAKLSFPSVHLTVGVFSDELCEAFGYPTTVPYVERCELLRHCRWVDEILPDAPWQINEQLLFERRIDYVAIDEGATVDPAYDNVRLKGYDALKRQGVFELAVKFTRLSSSSA
ncbi:Nucleotidylyl transferase [Dendrothele bispora CBS 962.96]|uniref:choline-phosphate cytidylyltransferase n=1 Tax=Dendrothele bispora (strain CBS 962.96) TaxID=1314807 RepID=A0A4S8M9L5_DENBC|nr:Nucleotidylyl transferase [Dendrothele bispora CBS 962.96]